MLNQSVSSSSSPYVAVSARSRITPRPRLGHEFFRLVPALVDVLLIILSFEIGRQLNALYWGEAKAYPLPSAGLYTLFMVVAMYLNEMYSFIKQRHTAELITLVLRCQGLALILVAPVLYLFPGLIERWFFIVTLSSQCVLLLIWRTILERRLLAQLGRQRVLIVGAGARARRIRQALQDRGSLVFEFVGCTADRTEESTSTSCRRVGASVDVCELVQQENIDHVVVAQDNPRDVFPASALLKLKHCGVAISEGEYFYERLMGKILTDYVRPSMLIFTASPMHHTIQIWLKNTIDFIVASILLIVTLPVMLVTAILIKLTSPGPIVYSQERVGLGGKTFTIYKFRSMRTDAEKDGAKWATQNDSRITPIGRFIRKTRIDELPQLLNVLKGEMSMVGPRPERPQFVNNLKLEIPFYELRHTMRPGLSGWAQVRYQYGSSVDDAHEKLRYDLYYIKNYSLFLDLTILLETTKVVIFGSGAR
ncbi:MAG TPA: TIGR03013 family XrtA/PEP-CTERM system glycosyltransferase [Planctomycetota bacterium]|nr:TIGR03013 family XrtA/PEP-CTERM system glycosyltransferase [Planctomycetota bacterium]